MCKKSLLMMLLLALLVPWAANAQTTVEIGDGTVTSNTNPIGTYYNYSITEQLYTAEEIGTAGTINSVSFYYKGIAARDLPITMYMKHVDEENLASGGISLADADEVFSGTLSVTTTAGWVTITLDTPFAYDGQSNLLIGFIKDYLYYFSGQSWQGTATTATMARYTQSDSAGPYTTGTVPGTAQANRPNIQIVITPSSGPTCEKPATLEASNVTSNSATLTWTGGSGTYNVEYKGGDAEDWTAYLTNTTATTANLTNLAPATTYSYRVQSVCGEDVSGWKSVSFMTLFGIPLVEEFGTTIPTGWAQYTGLMGGVLADTIELTAATYGWNFGTNNGVFDDHARVNIYGTSCKYWLVMPTINMENNVQLMFDVAYTAYSGTGAPAQGGTDDKFVVLINNGRSWEILRQWDNAGSQYVLNNLNTTPATVAIDLSSYAGQEIAIAFYGESTESNADNNLHIDNVSIDYIPACQKPTNLAVNYEGGTEVTVSWESPATAWQIGYSTDGFVTEQYVEVTENPYTLTGLELGTTYDVRVQTNCGDGNYSVFTNSVSFTTHFCMPENMCAITIEVTDAYGDGGGQIQVVDVLTNEVLGTYTNSSSSTTYTLNVCEGREINFVYASTDSWSYENGWVITDINNEIISEHVGCSSSGSCDAPTNGVIANYTMNCTVTDCKRPTDLAVSEISGHSAVLSWTENGEATEWIVAYTTDGVNYTEFDATTNNPFTLTGLDPETQYGVKVRPICSDFDDKWSNMLVFTTDVACPKPTNLNVTAYTTSADVAWEGLADAYDLEWALLPATESKDALWLQYDDESVTNNIGNSTVYEWEWAVMYPADMLQGNGMLTKVAYYETSYYSEGEPLTIKIYSGGDSAPETLVYTEEITCQATGGIREVALSEPVTINPTQNLWIVLNTTTLTYPMAMCGVDEANGRWVNNGGTWGDIGTMLASVADKSFMIRGYVEPAYDPSTLEWNPVSGVTSPYTIEGLQPETTYVVRVKAVCGGDDGESAWTMTTFTTHSACDMPNTFSAEVEATSATLSWVGYQESYNLRYRRTPYVATTYFSEDFDEGLPATWTTIDNDTTTVGNWIALSEINNVYTYYTSPLTGWAHSGADAVASASYVNGEGAVATDNYLVTPQVTFNGKLRFYATSEYEDPDTYEVLLSTTGNSISDFNVTLQAMGPATYNAWDEVIIDLSDYAGQQGYIAIHHVATDKYWLVIDDFGMYDFVYEDWTNVTATENTYTATGLTPEAEYEWQVQGVNASCGELEWSEIQNFTTPEQTTITQTTALVGGEYNRVSIYVVVEDPVAMLNALKAQLGEGTTIESADYSTENYGDGDWFGDLDDIGVNNQEMYLILTPEDCSFELQGMPADPAQYRITLLPYTWNRIGFPCSVTVSVVDALAGYEAEVGDQIEGPNGITEYYGDGDWFGDFEEFVPGEGYMYYSAKAEDDILIFSTGAKKTRNAKPVFKNAAVAKKAVLNVIDIEPKK